MQRELRCTPRETNKPFLIPACLLLSVISMPCVDSHRTKTRTSTALASPRTEPHMTLRHGTLIATFEVACSTSRVHMMFARTSPVANRLDR